jgi:hypothetical protein
LIQVALGLNFMDTFKMVVRRERGKMQASLQSMTTRPAAVVGQFYAGDPDQLRTQILQLFADVEPSANVRPKALIAPHAGCGTVKRSRRCVCSYDDSQIVMVTVSV